MSISQKIGYRVLHLPTTVGGNPQGISKHLSELGIESHTWTINQNYYGYPADKLLIKSNFGFIKTQIVKLLALSYVLKYDVIFFNFGRSLFQPVPFKSSNEKLSIKMIISYCWFSYNVVMQKMEFFLLRILQRKCMVQYQGDDARQGDFCDANFKISISSQVEDSYYTKYSDHWKREQINLFSKNCAKIYALNPDLLYVLPNNAEFLPYSHISINEWVPHYTQLEERPLRIGHAPTHRGVKGSNLIIKAVENLKLKGFLFEFVLIEGLSNSEAKEIYKTIDVLVDQLFAGWYGGLAVEVMALGKPVIVYIREEDLKFIPVRMREDLPFLKTTPDDIELSIEYVLTLPREELLGLAKKSREYVQRWHNPREIAKRIKNDIENVINTN